MLLLLTAGVVASNLSHAQQSATKPQLYSQGDPSKDEQYLLQQLNRARLDPVGEGQRLAAWLRTTPEGQSVVSYYGTNPAQVISDFAALPVVPPLAFDPDLLKAALGHSEDLAAHNGVYPSGGGHIGYDGSSPTSRVLASGYTQDFSGENAGVGPNLLDDIHAGYLVDWGNPDLGHRQQSMNGTSGLNVVGMGVAATASNLLVDTEDYGMPFLSTAGGKLSTPGAPAMLTGVVYHDANGNGQYDPGEGLAGVKVSMQNGAYYAVTTASGGYAFPLVNADGSNATGTVTVQMAFTDGSTRAGTVAVKSFATPFGPYLGNVAWNGLVTDEPNAPTINPMLASITGGGSLDKGARIALVVSRPSNQTDLSAPLTVEYTVKGSAVANVDYAPLAGSLTIPAGKDHKKLWVQALDNTVLNRPAGTLSLKVKLTGVPGAQSKATVVFVP